MYCSNCGAQIAASARFCPQCVADLTRSGAVRLTPMMSEAEIVREMPDELIDTAIRPPLDLSDLPPLPAAPRHGVAAPASSPTPTDPHHEVPLDPRTFDEPAQARRAEAAQRRVRAAASRQHTRRNQVAVVVLTLALLTAVVPIVIVSWSFFNLSPGDAATPSASSATPVASTPAASLTQAASSRPAPSKPATSSSAVVKVSRLPWPSYTRACGADVAANQQTSCEFAVVVFGKIDRKRTGTFTVTATSPVTNRSYTLNCSRPDFIVCTGGNSVRILIQPL
ncbi:zinc ribbon domain-containing protein [Aestuariimicrobium soli]|uniref:zinc ribbon domain-containing protein n=1 Tax=Aestuariimicrobium soli TaxID=2035834 RepID=UPI003EB78361